MHLAKEKLFPIIIGALKEDIGSGDITSSIIFEKDVSLLAHIIAKEKCVIAGIDAARWVFDAVDEKIAFTVLCKDGDIIKKGKRIMSMKGSAKSILSAERTALNFIGHLSGVATLTAEFVRAVKGAGSQIYDTRKTTPGMRELEKYAVAVGGGHGYRIGLWDKVLIKDNHINGSMLQAKGSRLQAIKNLIGVFKNRGYGNIEIEVENIAEFKEALEAGADIIMLDNMKPEEIKKAVKIIQSQPRNCAMPILEVSGGISLDNVRKIAHAGVDRISIGMLTHSAPSIDFSLEICK